LYGKGPEKVDATPINHAADPISIEETMKPMGTGYKLCCKGLIKQFRMHGFGGLRSFHPGNKTEIIRNP
jgi:hypothetical protein